MKDWLKKGEWVQTYTARGSPRTGYDALRWRSNRVRLEEWICGVVILLSVILGFWGWLIWETSK